MESPRGIEVFLYYIYRAMMVPRLLLIKKYEGRRERRIYVGVMYK